MVRGRISLGLSLDKMVNLVAVEVAEPHSLLGTAYVLSGSISHLNDLGADSVVRQSIVRKAYDNVVVPAPDELGCPGEIAAYDVPGVELEVDTVVTHLTDVRLD